MKLVGSKKSARNSGVPAATLRRTNVPEPPPVTLRCTTQHSCPADVSCSQPTVPSTTHSGDADAEGPTWRSTPRLIPSTQCKFSQKAPRKSLVGMRRTLAVRAVFPCDDNQCKEQTLRQRQDNLKKAWEFWRLVPLTDARPAHPTCSRACGPGRSVSGAA